MTAADTVVAAPRAAVEQISADLSRSADMRRLYLAFPLMGLAISVVTSGQFFDMILLRLGLNMQQFGVIKGLGFCLPQAINLLLAPLLLRLAVDRWVASIGHLVRIVISFVFLALPYITRDRTALTILYTVAYVTWMLPPTMANNS